MYSYWRARTSSGGCSWVTQGPPVATVVCSTVRSTVTNWVTNLVSSLVEPRFSLSLVSLLEQPTRKAAAKATTTRILTCKTFPKKRNGGMLVRAYSVGQTSFQTVLQNLFMPSSILDFRESAMPQARFPEL